VAIEMIFAERNLIIRAQPIRLLCVMFLEGSSKNIAGGAQARPYRMGEHDNEREW
jgi:hypothetical protein